MVGDDLLASKAWSRDPVHPLSLRFPTPLWVQGLTQASTWKRNWAWEGPREQEMRGMSDLHNEGCPSPAGYLWVLAKRYGDAHC